MFASNPDDVSSIASSSAANSSEDDSPRLSFSPPHRSSIVKLPSLTRWGEHASEANGTPFEMTKLSSGGCVYPYDLVPRFRRADDLNNRICLWHGDITMIHVDGIVNAANTGLWAGGGICGAIHAAAGPLLGQACAKIGTPPGRCPTGETVITRGYELPAKFVLHTVGPTTEDVRLLRNSYFSTLELAVAHGLESIALCCVSTGIFGFPLRRATHVALHSVRQWLEAHPHTLDIVVFSVFTEDEYEIYEKLLPCYFPRDCDAELADDFEVPPVPTSPKRSGSMTRGWGTRPNKYPCRYGSDCRSMSDRSHCVKYSHPDMDGPVENLSSNRFCFTSSQKPDKEICLYGLECRFMNDDVHRARYSHTVAYDVIDRKSNGCDDVPPPPLAHPSVRTLRICRYGDECRERHNAAHCQRYSHPGEEALPSSNACGTSLTPCRYGVDCRDQHDAFHCQKYAHPIQQQLLTSNQFTATVRLCRYGRECKDRNDAFHCERYSHPGQESFAGVSQSGDQHIGTKYPRVICKSHPGCPKRRTCWYSHGLVHSIAPQASSDGQRFTCFLGHAPHNQACTRPTQSGEAFDFCSADCKSQAFLTPKGALGCRRENCPCPCTVNGAEGQFCCDVCAHGTPCSKPTHVCPSSHLVAVAKPQRNKFSSCARSGCKCADEHGSSWNGKPGQYCCRACRNGTPCTKLWHTVPEAAALANAQKSYRGNECALESCTRATWNGRAGEYCCLDHRRADRQQKSDKSEGSKDSRFPVAIPDVAVRLLLLPKFPDYPALFKNAESWVATNSANSQKGKVGAVWQNMSLNQASCPARLSFERAIDAAKLDSWEDGEFGWHGTKSLAAIKDICWSNWDTAKRKGQAAGPGEYFSRGTGAGIQYSQTYAGGDAGNLLIVAWIMSHKRGASPNSPGTYGAGAPSTGHIVCNNPVSAGNVSTGTMYCIPIAVVAFGSAGNKPAFRTS